MGNGFNDVGQRAFVVHRFRPLDAPAPQLRYHLRQQHDCSHRTGENHLMYLIRRVIKTKPGKARQVADLLIKIGGAYVDAGQRSPIRVYTSGGTVPGPANTVYIDWIAEKIESPMRPGNKIPEETSKYGAELRELQEESSIEFYTLYHPTSVPK